MQKGTMINILKDVRDDIASTELLLRSFNLC